MIQKCIALLDGIECGLDLAEIADQAELIALQVVACPLGHRSYLMPSEGIRKESDQLIDTTGFDFIEFRKKSTEETWHLISSCSEWPTKDFIRSKILSRTDVICNECLATSRMNDV